MEGFEDKQNRGLIIFDFDGTLGDTRRNIVTTMQMTIKELQLPSRTEAECASTMEPGTLLLCSIFKIYQIQQFIVLTAASFTSIAQYSLVHQVVNVTYSPTPLAPKVCSHAV